jgi:integrase
MSALATVHIVGGLPSTEILARARDYAEASVSANTRRAYATDWRDFAAFCDAHALVAMPATPQTIAAYATSLADRAKISTIRRRLATVSVLHQRAGHDSPCGHRIVRDVVRGIARELGVAPTRKDAVTLEGLRALLLAIAGDDVAAMRDRAIILLGFAAALRRSEIAALRVEDLRWSKHGLLVRIARSKTDQLGEGVELAVPFVPTESMCAVRAVKRYVLAAGITSGPLFRSLSPNRRMSDGAIDGRDVARLVKKLALRARLGGDFSGHSLRAGFATSAAAARVSLDAIARTTRHKSLAVLLTYVRPAQAFDDVALSTMIA